MFCSICGGSDFVAREVLWNALINEWQISQAETAYINRQQGCACAACGANLRVVALGSAVLRACRSEARTITDLVSSSAAHRLRILDMNGAFSLSDVLCRLDGYVRGDYPAVDMHNLQFADGAFDLVIHSDTLEHIAYPVRGLEECRRVLSPQGRLCFTVPMILGRMTRNRTGLPPSYHGDPTNDRGDFLVHSEFGADAWTYVMQAGFSHVTLNQVEFPSAVAMTAWVE